jgi:uncharacterized protein YcbK (DUF882 family)
MDRTDEVLTSRSMNRKNRPPCKQQVAAEPIARRVTLTRRRFMRVATVAAATALIPHRALAGLRLPTARPRSLALHNLHTGESLRAVYWTAGGYIREAVENINFILRDFRTGEIKPINPGLLDLMHAIAGRLDTREPFLIISGYRSAATNAMLHAHGEGVSPRSFHMKGMAADIRLPGRELSALRSTALALHRGGVGFYPKSDFVHIDVGRVRWW